MQTSGQNEGHAQQRKKEEVVRIGIVDVFGNEARLTERRLA